MYNRTSNNPYYICSCAYSEKSFSHIPNRNYKNIIFCLKLLCKAFEVSSSSGLSILFTFFVEVKVKENNLVYAY